MYHFKVERYYTNERAMADMVIAISMHFKDCLTPREAYIMEHLLLGHTYDEIADELHLERQKVINIYRKSLERIKIHEDLLSSKDKQIESLKAEVASLKKNALPEELKNKLPLLLMPIKKTNLSNRLKNGLSHNAHSVFDIVQMKRSEVCSIKGVGKNCIVELDEWLREHCLTYDMDVREYLNNIP